MTDISALLDKKVGDYKEPPKFPAANFRMIISGYSFGTNKKSGAIGVAFKAKPLSCVEAEDDSNPDLQNDMNIALEVFGDWTGKEFSFTWTDKETGDLHLMGFCPLNFHLYNADQSEHKGASFFYLNKDGVQSGFVHDVLGLDFDPETSLGDLLEGCLNAEFYAQFEYQENRDPSRQPNLVISNVTSV